MTDTYICILKDTDIKLWGLSGRERLSRMISKHDNAVIVEEASQTPANMKVLLLRADHLFEPRLLQALLQLENDMALYASNSDEVVAVRTKSEDAQTLTQELLGEAENKLISTLAAKKADDLVKAYDPRLLKYDPPVILPINRENKTLLENELFSGSYKGITDFVTKWLWPVPARWAVGLCVRYKVSPNHVTLLSLVLAILAGLAFWGGFFLPGLLMGWFMTFLDTVDGKLARVTISSSKMGDILDHGLDLIHPPLWYLAWGFGIAEIWTASVSVMLLFWIMLFAYIGGRLCEGAFELWIAPFRLFLWQPWDSYNRLITARRNPNLVILTLSLFFARPDIGLWLVVIWHVISTFVLMARIYVAYRQRGQSGELTPWLNNIDPERDRHRLEVRLFTRLSKSASA
jgi:phosphatidylglycerophosphate synthase